MEIRKLSEDKHQKLNILVYAPSGHGKTRFAGTAAAVAKPLFASAEKGLLSLKKLSKEMGKDFDYVQVDEFENLREIYDHFKEKDCPHDCVILDSLTEIQESCMASILKEENREKPQMQDWGTLNLRMVKMIRAFRDLDIHLIALALSVSDKDEETQSYSNKPLLKGALQNTVAGYFDEVFYLHAAKVKTSDGKEETKRWLQTAGNQKFLAKDRSGLLPSECPASFGWVYKAIAGETKGESQ